jgi:hypothetical protein
MAQNVITQILGGDKKVLDGVQTIGDIKKALAVSSYTATLNGSPASDSDSVEDGDFVSLSQAVKGGA